MPSRDRRIDGAVVLVALVLAGCAGISPRPATPQRPSYSSDTNTTAPGTAELETGFAFDESTIDTPLALKWGAAEATELFLGFSPYLRLDGGDDPSGPGDLVAGARVRFLEESPGCPSAALQLAAKLPTADDADGLGTGEVDAFGAAILAKTYDRTGVVGYYQLGVLGDPAGPGVDLVHGLALAVGHPLVGDLGGFIELAGIFTPDQDRESVFTTLGIGYALRASFVLDAAASLGLSEDATDASATFGATINLGAAR